MILNIFSILLLAWSKKEGQWEDPLVVEPNTVVQMLNIWGMIQIIGQRPTHIKFAIISSSVVFLPRAVREPQQNFLKER